MIQINVSRYDYNKTIRKPENYRPPGYQSPENRINRKGMMCSNCDSCRTSQTSRLPYCAAYQFRPEPDGICPDWTAVKPHDRA